MIPICSRRSKHNKIILETIAVSHYVEKVRWALDLLNIDYEEEQDCGIIGVFFTGRMVPGLRVPRQNFTIYNSDDILRYLYGKHYADPVRHFYFVVVVVAAAAAAFAFVSASVVVVAAAAAFAFVSASVVVVVVAAAAAAPFAFVSASVVVVVVVVAAAAAAAAPFAFVSASVAAVEASVAAEVSPST